MFTVFFWALGSLSIVNIQIEALPNLKALGYNINRIYRKEISFGCAKVKIQNGEYVSLNVKEIMRTIIYMKTGL